MISNKAFFISIAIMTVTLTLLGFISVRSTPVVISTNLERLPMMIEGYSAIEDSFPDAVYRELNADMHVYRHYSDNIGTPLDLYIGYYGTAKGGRTGHNPFGCLPGAGWAIVESKEAVIGNSSTKLGTEVNYVRARKDGMNTIMLHWYQSGEKVMSTGLRQNMERFWGRLLHNRNDGAFVRISAQVPDDLVAVADTNLLFFAGRVLKLLPEHWPTEK